MTIDTSFVTSGVDPTYTTIQNDNRDRVSDIILDEDNKIMVLWTKNPTGTDSNNSDSAVTHIDTSGALDTSFASSGTLLLQDADANPVNYYDFKGAMILDNNDMLNVVASVENGTN